QARVAAEIQKRGGSVTVDRARPGHPVVEVRLAGPTVRDADLAPLERLAELRQLVLHQTHVRGPGLKVLEQCPRLRELFILACTRVDRDWLKYLSPLTGLRRLHLCYTEVSDEGLGHLQGLTGLEALDLTGTATSE